MSAGLGFSAGLGRCRRASAARRVSAALERVGGDSGRRLPQEAGRPRLRREDPCPGPAARPFSPSGNAFLRAASVAPARRRGRWQEGGRWGWVQTKEPGGLVLSTEGMALR